jgi:predicted GNAT family N-acyltransferase
MAYKFNSVVEKNTGYALIKKYDCINGTKNINVEQQPAIVACNKMSPITSVEVE